MADGVSFPIPNDHQVILHELRKSDVVNIRGWDVEANKLSVVRWPNFGPNESPFTRGRVPPTEFSAYRRTHKFKFPCCLCPSLSRLLGQNDRSRIYTEAAIYRPTEGPYKGKFVAQCAQGRCGYLVPIEEIYTKSGVQPKIYPRRGKFCLLPTRLIDELWTDEPFADTDEPAPPPVRHYTEVATEVIRPQAPPARNATPGPARGLRRTYAAEFLLDRPAISPSPPHVQARFTFATDTVPARYGTPLDLFGPAPQNRHPNVETWQYFKLECIDERFRHLVAKCRDCGVLKKNGAFHVCAPPEVIDLTGDESDEEMDWVFTDAE
ncbi:hypothetical protein BD410DRAFT_845860 [Rickenella mellea]|uniref:Uncharacterized protein n=1 Tax=Rickenella mellea TaxID=50990 RepID=A0A4Y7PI20_9AGAM|nr:hypothetical protein BD410DRAFT_845860 [Rickenella mellea]